MCAPGHQHRHSLGLGKVREVIKVAVRPVREKNVAVARAQWRGGDDGHTATHVLHQVAAAFGKGAHVHALHYARTGDRAANRNPWG